MEIGKDIAREEQETTAMEPLSPISRMFVSPSLYCFIIFTLGFQTRCNQSSIVEGVKNTWIKLPRFSSKVDIKKYGKAFWIPVSVRIEDHVIVPDIDYSNIENPDQFIEDYTSNIANTPMDMSRPLWELHLLNIMTSNAESLAIGKFHHSLGDGMSLMSLLLASSRKTSDPEAFPTTAATKKHVDSNIKGWWLVERFWFMLRAIFITVIEMFKYLLTLCFMRDTKTPLMGKTGDRIRSNKAGLSRYLKKKSDIVAEKKSILEHIRLRGTVFINLRADTKIEELANMMAKDSKCKWGNFVGFVMFPLWIRSEDDSLEYVRRAKSIMDIKKLSMEQLLCYGLIKFTMKIFGEQVAETLSKRIFDHTTLSFSNVLGPDEEISFFDHPMSYVAASAIGGPQALIIHYVSYVNKIVINLSVDTTVIPDPHLLCDDLVESLNIIKLAAMEKGVHKMEV